MISGDGWVVHLGSCLDVLPTLPDNSVDSIVTDPPYELGFMGKKWDSTGIAFNPDVWVECLRVLKPGGHLLAFGGSRTWHRLAVAIEDAGFEVRDSIAWLYGSGFPKSMNIGKAIDKGERPDREVGIKPKSNMLMTPASVVLNPGSPVTPEAVKWQGWGTALKPAFEPIVVARKPLIGTVAANVLEWGVGGLNIDGTRIGTETVTINSFDNGAKPFGGAVGEPFTSRQSQGRWPANVMLDEYTAALLDEQADASRFFYVAKANKRDRNEGLDGLPEVRTGAMTGTAQADLLTGSGNERTTKRQNFHPTVKPTDLMRQLVRLVTPPGGMVLDPFTGSGSTGKAAILEGLEFVGIEITEDYLPIIEGRLRHALSSYKTFNEKVTNGD